MNPLTMPLFLKFAHDKSHGTFWADFYVDPVFATFMIVVDLVTSPLSQEVRAPSRAFKDFRSNFQVRGMNYSLIHCTMAMNQKWSVIPVVTKDYMHVNSQKFTCMLTSLAFTEVHDWLCHLRDFRLL